MEQPIIHVNFSQTGGAGQLAHTLATAQTSAGRDSRVLSIIEGTLRTEPLTSPIHTASAGIDRYLIQSPTFSAPISLLRDQGPSNILNLIPEHAVVHLHGYNGALSLGDIAAISSRQKLVWTFHDMNPFTGACHYALGCTSFSAGCDDCPAVRPAFRPLVSHHHRAKMKAFALTETASLVAPSEWLARLARTSSIFDARSVSVIPNPYAPAFEKQSSGPSDPSPARSEKSVTVGVVAADLLDPVKNVAEAVAAFRRARERNPSLRLALVGARGEEYAGPGVEIMGALKNEALPAFYSLCDVIVMPSLAENAPLVIIEASSQGCPTLAREAGGSPELLTRLGFGSVYTSAHQLSELLESFTPLTLAARTALRDKTHEVFSPSTVAKQYDEVYES